MGLAYRTMRVDVQLDTVEVHATLPSVINHASMVFVHRRKRVRVKLDGWEVDVIKVREMKNVL